MITAAGVKTTVFIVFWPEHFERAICCGFLANLGKLVIHFPCEMVHTIYKINAKIPPPANLLFRLH